MAFFLTPGIFSSILWCFQYFQLIYAISFCWSFPRPVLLALPPDRLGSIPGTLQWVSDVMSGPLSRQLLERIPLERNLWPVYPSKDIHNRGKPLHKPFPSFLTSAGFLHSQQKTTPAEGASWLCISPILPPSASTNYFQTIYFLPSYFLNLLVSWTKVIKNKVHQTQLVPPPSPVVESGLR